MNIQKMQKYIRARREYQQLKSEWDVVLEPIPPMPQLRSLSNGNWANDWLGTTELRGKLMNLFRRKVVVIVHDTAGYFSNKYLARFAWNEKGFNRTTDGKMDVHGHGEHCGGIYGAVHPDIHLGVAAAMVEAGFLKGIPGKCLGDRGQGSWTWIAGSIEQGLDIGNDLQAQGYFVIHSMSLGGGGYSNAIAKLIQQGIDAGQVFCIAAGNSGREGLQFPSKVPGVMAWGSHDPSGNRSSFSTFADGLFAAAPGQNILSTLPGDRLAAWSGTSMATPAGGAVVAMLASIYPDLKGNEAIQTFVSQFITDVMEKGRDKFTGFGSPVLLPYLGKDIEDQPDEEPEKPEDPQELEQPENPAPEPEPEPEEPMKPVFNQLRLVVPDFEFTVHLGGFNKDKIVMKGHLDVEVSSKRYLENIGADLQTILRDYMSRTGLILGKQHDLDDGARYLAWFVEMELDRKHDTEIKVIQVEVTEAKGLSFRHFPKNHWSARGANLMHDMDDVQLIHLS